jgi:hypothetical protein
MDLLAVGRSVPVPGNPRLAGNRLHVFHTEEARTPPIRAKRSAVPTTRGRPSSTPSFRAPISDRLIR